MLLSFIITIIHICVKKEKMQSIKLNFIYNAILTMSGYLFPLIVYPYVSRKLGVANMGACNFVDSIVEYFTIISMMGMNIIGVREIAKCKKNKTELSKTFSELFTLNFISTIVSIAVLTATIFIVPKFSAYNDLLYIGVSKLLFNFLLINWFFQGIENFKYVTIRSVLVKTLFVISIFCFVKTPNDTIIYYGLVMGTIALNAIINVLFTCKLIHFHLSIKIRREFVVSFFVFGLYWFMNSMYSTLNVAYLGFLTNDTEVGYYTTANKLLTIIMTLFTTLTTVMVPRISSVVSSDNNINNTFISLVGKSFNVFISFIFPLVFFVIVFSPEIIFLMSGKGYEGAILPLRLIAPLFFVIGYDQILVLQIMMPLKNDKLILRNSMIAAFVGLVTNFALVPYYGRIGSAIVQLCAETTVLVTSQICVYKLIKYRFPFAPTYKRMVSTLPLLFAFIFLKNIMVDYQVVAMLGAAILCPLYILVVEYNIFKNEVVINVMNQLTKKITNK